MREVSCATVSQTWKAALIDTGSTQTLVQCRYVSPHSICSTETIPICCAHGDERHYPTADVYIKVQGQTYLLNVGVIDNLPFPVILGDDLPVLIDLLQPKSCNVALTRAQAKKSGEREPTLSALPFYNAGIDLEPAKERKSRRQRRLEKFQHTAVSAAWFDDSW